MADTKLIRLSVPEVHFALALATQRDACKPNRDSRISKKMSGFGVHLSGVIGELCFRKVHGGKINQDISPLGDQHSPDIELPDGRLVEVKTSLFHGTGVEIKFEYEEIERFEHCGLVQVTMPDTGLVFPVWSRDEVYPMLEKKDYGYGPRLVYRPR